MPRAPYPFHARIPLPRVPRVRAAAAPPPVGCQQSAAQTAEKTVSLSATGMKAVAFSEGLWISDATFPEPDGPVCSVVSPEL